MKPTKFQWFFSSFFFITWVLRMGRCRKSGVSIYACMLCMYHRCDCLQSLFLTWQCLYISTIQTANMMVTMREWSWPITKLIRCYIVCIIFVIWIRSTVRCPYNAVTLLTNIHKRHPHGSPFRARYGVSFVDPRSDWYSDSFHVIIYVISCNIGPCYCGTRLDYEYSCRSRFGVEWTRRP